MKATDAETVLMLALSSLLSSVFVYNIRGGLVDSNMLQELNFFVEYGKTALNGPSPTQARNGGPTPISTFDKTLAETWQTDDGKPFQHLMFLLRDWQYPQDYSYGSSPGYLNTILDINGAGGKNYLAQHRELSKQLQNGFDLMSCFLMPHIGECVSDGDFRGELHRTSPKFQHYLPQLVESIVRQNITRAKRIGNETVSA